VRATEVAPFEFYLLNECFLRITERWGRMVWGPLRLFCDLDLWRRPQWRWRIKEDEIREFEFLIFDIFGVELEAFFLPGRFNSYRLIEVNLCELSGTLEENEHILTQGHRSSQESIFLMNKKIFKLERNVLNFLKPIL